MEDSDTERSIRAPSGNRVSPDEPPTGGANQRRFLAPYGIAVGAAATVPAVTSIVLPNHVQMVSFDRVFTGSDSSVDLQWLNDLNQRVQAGLVSPTPDQQRLIDLLMAFDSARTQSLSLVIAVGVFVAMLVQPIAGALSDRTRSRWGRRTPWLALGALLGAVGLIGLHLSASIASLIALWALTLAALNIATGPLAATVADRVEPRAIGRASLVTGVANVLGGLGGTVVAGALFTHLQLNIYLIAAAVLVCGIALFLIIAREQPISASHRGARAQRAASLSLRNRLRDFDFRFAWVARLLLMLATAVPSTFGLYMLQSHVQPTMSAADATRLVSVLAVVALPLMLITMTVAGRWSDKIGRRKPFVFSASLMLSGLALIPAVSPTLPVYIMSSLLTTAAVGIFIVVDQALFIDLIGDTGSAGRDLGIATLAGSIGQALGPLIAGHMIGTGSGYGALWVVSAAIAFASALAILPVRRVR